MGYAYALLLFASSIAQSLTSQHYFYRMALVGIRIRTALMNLIYKKVITTCN